MQLKKSAQRNTIFSPISAARKDSVRVPYDKGYAQTHKPRNACIPRGRGAWQIETTLSDDSSGRSTAGQSRLVYITHSIFCSNNPHLHRQPRKRKIHCWSKVLHQQQSQQVLSFPRNTWTQTAPRSRDSPRGIQIRLAYCTAGKK